MYAPIIYTSLVTPLCHPFCRHIDLRADEDLGAADCRLGAIHPRHTPPVPRRLDGRCAFRTITVHCVGLMHCPPVAMLDNLKQRITTFLIELFTLIITFLLS